MKQKELKQKDLKQKDLSQGDLNKSTLCQKELKQRESKQEELNQEELKQIYYLNKEIRMWEEELDRLNHQSFVKGQNITGLPAAGRISDRTAELAVEMAELERTIRRKLEEIQMARKRIIDYITGVEDSYMRQIIYLRNVSCMRWEEIADELGGSGESIRQAYSRFLRAQTKSCHTCHQGRNYTLK